MGVQETRLMKPDNRRRAGIFVLATLGLLLMAVPAFYSMRPHGPHEPGQSAVLPADATPSVIDGQSKDIRETATAFCGACHAMPPADSFPKSAWRKEVEQGYEFYRQSSRKDLTAPPEEQVVAFFTERAPERLTLPELPPDDDPPLLTFQPQVPALSGSTNLPALAHLRLVSFDHEGPASLVYSDMDSGEIGALSLGQNNRHDRVLATLP